MQLPLVTQASVVSQHASHFHELFQNSCQIRHFENYLTGLITLDNKTLSNMALCILDSADKTNISRFLSEAKWQSSELNDKRIAYMLAQTVDQRRKAKDGVLPIDDTMCEHVGSLFEYVDRHYNHTDGSFPLAHNLVTAHFVSGVVRFPVDYRVYQRYETVTRWEEFVKKHFPNEIIPRKSKERAQLRKRLMPTLLTDPEFVTLHNSFETKIELAVQLVEYAVAQNLPFATVLFDSWYLSPELVTALQQHHKDWISILKTNRLVLTNSFGLKDATGQAVTFAKSSMKLSDIVPLIPTSSFKPVEVDGSTYHCFTKNVIIPSLGQVRLVISFNNPSCEGNYVVLITNCLSWNAKKIIATYLLRWPIETFYQDCKQQLGLDEYRMRTADAIGKHWHLLFMAYSFLHLDCLPNSSGKRQQLSPLQTIGQAVRRQQQAAIQGLILYAHRALQSGQKTVQELFDTLFAKQQLCPT